MTDKQELFIEQYCLSGNAARSAELAGYSSPKQRGYELKNKLKQKGGFASFFSGILFGVILKVLKFFFLDQIVEELQKKESSQITSTDIEHAVRRVGTEVMISPITDNLFLVHALNIALGILLFGMPFALLWLI